MVQKIRTKLMAIAALALFTVPLLPATVNAQGADAQPRAGLCSGANRLEIESTTNPPNDCSTFTEDTTSVNDIIATVINILSIVVGIIAVIMIIVGGFRYITSGGNAERVTGAKNTILYAIIGLIIVALAQVIVRFVLSKATEVD